MVSAVFTAAGAATCSKMNLTRCLDSVCAINIGANPAARCQLCGTSSAGTAPANTGLRNLSVGASARYTFTDRELNSAPSEPGPRYAWATTECMKKVEACTPDDVSDTYDSLIEQSCKAAGVTADMASLLVAAKKTKNRPTCDTDIRTCFLDNKRCGADYSACEDNANFDKFFSACVIEVGGCDEFIESIRPMLVVARDTAIKSKDTLLANITKTYQDQRTQKLNTAKTSCTDNSARDSCIKSVCENNMRNKCGIGFESEKSMATLLCGFHDVACNRLK